MLRVKNVDEFIVLESKWDLGLASWRVCQDRIWQKLLNNYDDVLNIMNCH